MDALSERCETCGHFMDAHCTYGCLALVPVDDGPDMPVCPCKVPGRQQSLI